MQIKCVILNIALKLTVLCALVLAAVTSHGANQSQPQADKNAVKTATSHEKYIVKDGISQGKIFFPANADKAMIFAIQELREHLKKMSGADIEMAWRELKPNDSGFVFKIRPENEWRGKDSAQTFTIEEDAATCQVRISGNTELAVLYGVYQYLGDLGVRWLTPGDIGTNIPKMSDIPIRPGKRIYSPSFLSRVLALSSTTPEHFGGSDNIEGSAYDYGLYLIRNRTQLARNIAPKYFGFDLSLTGTAHAVKPMTGLGQSKEIASLMEKEPERFALVTGDDFVQKRRYEDGQVCFSNEKNIQTAISNCIAFFKKLEDTRASRNSDLDEDATVPMGLSDGLGICECSDCAKIAGKEPNSKDRLVWSFWNHVAKGLNEKMPGRKIGVFAPYMDVTQPPDDVKIEPNVLAVATMVYKWEKAPENKDSYPFPKSYLQWVTKIHDAGATLGCYDYQNYPISPTPLQILDRAQGYAKLGFKHYHMEAMQRTEYDWPIVWSLAQFTWDSSKEPREYLKTFCREYYGTPYDQDILWILEEMARNSFTMQRIIFGSAADTSAMLPDVTIAEGRARLKEAVPKANGQQQERLRRFADSIEAQFQLAETYRAYCQALNNRTDEDISEFAKRANSLIDLWGKTNLQTISTSSFRTSKLAAERFLKTDFADLKPSARKELAGMGPKDERWMKELFAGTPVPNNVPHLFPLPENWKFHIDYENKGLENGYFKADYDDRNSWPEISSWSMPSSQGYPSQIGGYFWYRVKFKAPQFPVGKKVFLRIGSLDDTGDIYLNGVKVGSQSSPYNWDKSFVIDVTKEIRHGEENVLVVHGYDADGGEGVWRPSALYTE